MVCLKLPFILKMIFLVLFSLFFTLDIALVLTYETQEQGLPGALNQRVSFRGY